MKLLYANFLGDVTEHKHAEAYWAQIVSRLAEKHGQSIAWTPWADKFYLNGTPMERDGSPIFEAKCTPVKRFVNITQLPPRMADGSDQFDIGFYLDERMVLKEHNNLEGEAWGQLAISCILSEETSSVVEDLIEQWLNPEISVAAMEKILDEKERELATSYPVRQVTPEGQTPEKLQAYDELALFLERWHPNGGFAAGTLLLGILEEGQGVTEVASYLDDMEKTILKTPCQTQRNYQLAEKIMDWWKARCAILAPAKI